MNVMTTGREGGGVTIEEGLGLLSNRTQGYPGCLRTVHHTLFCSLLWS